MGNYSSNNSVSGFSKIPNIYFKYQNWNSSIIKFTGLSINISNLNAEEKSYLIFNGTQYILREIIIDLSITSGENTEIQLVHERTDLSLQPPITIINVMVNNMRGTSIWNILFGQEDLNISHDILTSVNVPFRFQSKHVFLQNFAALIIGCVDSDKFYYVDNRYEINNTKLKTNFIIVKTPLTALNFVANMRNTCNALNL